MLANKADCITYLEAELEEFRELTGLRYPMLAVSAITGQGPGEIGPWFFRDLGIVHWLDGPTATLQRRRAPASRTANASRGIAR